MEPRQVDERMSCAVLVRMTVGGQLAWISSARAWALTCGARKDSIEESVVQAGA